MEHPKLNHLSSLAIETRSKNLMSCVSPIESGSHGTCFPKTPTKQASTQFGKRLVIRQLPSPIAIFAGLCGALMVCACGAPEPGERELGEAGNPLEGCPAAAAPAQTGKLATSGVNEASGLTRSIQNPGVYYTHNDSGGAAEVYAIDGSGKLLATIALSGARAQDWEDISVGPGPGSGSYVYVGDIGDNALSRSSVTVYRFSEPKLDTSQTQAKLSATVEALKFTYPDGSQNAETLLVDPVTGDLSIVSKADSGSRVYVARPPFSSGSTEKLEYVTTVDFSDTGSPLATGGAVAPDGSAVLIRTYSSAVLFPRSSSGTLEEAFLGAGCNVPTASEEQGEAISFVKDSKQFFTLSEGQYAGLFRVDLK